MSNPIDPIEELGHTSSPKEWRKLTRASWSRVTFGNHFRAQLDERNKRRGQTDRESASGGSKDEVTIIATVTGITTGQPVLRRIDYIGAGSEEPRHFDFDDVDASPTGLIARLVNMVRSVKQGRIVLSLLRGIFSRDLTSDSIHFLKVWGDVVDHTEKAMIVRFNLNGLLEERAFWWDELNVTRQQVPMGTKLIGLARLVKAPETGESDDTGEVTHEIHETVEREITKLGPEASKLLGIETSSEDRARAFEELKRILSPTPDNEKDGSRGG